MENLGAGRSTFKKSSSVIEFKIQCNAIKEIINKSASQGAKMNGPFIFEIRNFLRSKASSYFTHLAFLNESMNVTKLKREERVELDRLLERSKSFLQQQIIKGLDVKQTEALLLTTLNSLSSEKKFKSNLFYFLIPNIALIVDDKKELAKIKTALASREWRDLYPGSQNLKLIALNHLIRKELSITDKHARKKENIHASEEYVAMAQREFFLQKPAKAFKILQTGLEKISQKKPANFLSYLEYIITKARELKKPEKEIFYTRHLIINVPHIESSYLSRIKELMNEATRKNYINEIISVIKQSHHNTFEKISDLLMSENRFDELIKEISKQNNKFTLLNDIAIKKFPEFDDNLFKVYARQFQNAIAQATETHYQEKIFSNAINYIDKLPVEERTGLLKEIVKGISKHGYIRSRIQKMYGI
ncbi:MAG: hypothetical protein JWO32_3108 [Bacteroidetes bacterium]|nr:hypothetical protein [Bacteroidota bacterium]